MIFLKKTFAFATILLIVTAVTFCDIDECASGPCRNGGTCMDGVNQFTCNCHGGWNGETCEEKMVELWPKSYITNFTPHGIISFYKTFASKVHVSKFLVQVSDTEDRWPSKFTFFGSNDCFNEENWDLQITFEDPIYDSDNIFQKEIDNPEKFRCYGIRVERTPHNSIPIISIIKMYSSDIDECASGPCKNGGTCMDGVNQFTCNCHGGWNGETCEENIDECASGPCKNGGTCMDGVNQFTCKCHGGWNGETCEENADCCETLDCSKYRGNKKTTASGRDCQPWNSDVPHDRNSETKANMESAGLSANYCRNPTKALTAWCYTMDEDKRFEYCDIPKCSEADDCSRVCPRNYQPICDTNGKTHGNKCTFEYAACEARKKNQTIAIHYQGPCKVPCTKHWNKHLCDKPTGRRYGCHWFKCWRTCDRGVAGCNEDHWCYITLGACSYDAGCEEAPFRQCS